jgi:hypothetical protein
LGNGAVVSGSIASGQIGRFQLSNSAVFSGNISSSEVGKPHLATTTAPSSGYVLTTDGTNIDWAQAATSLQSGGVTSGLLGNNSVVSGSIASGQIGNFHLSSGTAIYNLLSGSIRSGLLGNGSVVSGSIASGQVGQYHLASGFIPTATLTYTGQTANFTAYTIPDTSGVSVSVEYYVINTATNAYRSGIVLIVWNSTNDTVEYTDTSTNDLGNSTIGLYFTAAISTNNLVLTANITTGTWTVKLGARLL